MFAKAIAVILLLPPVILVGLFLATRYLSTGAEEKLPPSGQFVTARGLKIHYIVKGTGRDVVLIHGANGTLEDFRATVFDDLAAKYRVIAIDRPGHGYSQRDESRPLDPGDQAEIIHAALQKIGVSRPVIVGFSWGGAIATTYGLKWGDETAALVSIAGATYPWPTPVDAKWYLPTWPLIGRLLTETLVMPAGLILARPAVAESFAPDPVSPRYFSDGPLGLALRPASFRANAEDVRLLKPYLRSVSPHYGALKMPVEILHGDGDRVVSLLIHSRPLAAAAPAARLRILAGAGHLLPYSHPDEVIAAIDRAVARSSPAG